MLLSRRWRRVGLLWLAVVAVTTYCLAVVDRHDNFDAQFESASLSSTDEADLDLGAVDLVGNVSTTVDPATDPFHCRRNDSSSYGLGVPAGYPPNTPSCWRLLHGSPSDWVHAAARLIRPRPASTAANDDEKLLAAATENCEQFLVDREYFTASAQQQQRRRRPSESRDNGTESFPIAFTIMVHRDAWQAERLLRAIYRPWNAYCVHVDARSSWLVHAAVRAVADCLAPAVFVASRTHDVIYAGMSRLEADVDCMRDLARRRVDWKYVINLAATMFPLKTPEEMVEILRVYGGQNDIESMPMTSLTLRRVDYEFTIDVDKRQTVFRQPRSRRLEPLPGRNLTLLRGSAYGAFSRQFVDFVLKDSVARQLLEWSRKSYSPDEHYWATLHQTGVNPQLGTPGGYNGSLESRGWLIPLVRWHWEDPKCFGRYVHSICVFGVGDLPFLVQQPQLFLNKIYDNYQPLTLECLDAVLRHRTVCSRGSSAVFPPLDLDFYHRLPFVPSRATTTAAAAPAGKRGYDGGLAAGKSRSRQRRKNWTSYLSLYSTE